MNNNKGFLFFICSVASMGGLLFGYDWVVIGGAKPFYELYFGISESPVLQGVAMSTALVGCLIGAMVAGAAADRYGRKPLLIVAAVLFTVSAIATGMFNDFTLFNIARFIGGVGIGVASALSPMYIAEVSPTEIRGRMVSLNQMTIVLGILMAQVVNMLLARDTSVAESQAWNLEWGWRWMFWAETVPAAIFLVMSFAIPESPVYLRMKDEDEEMAIDELVINEKDYVVSTPDDKFALEFSRAGMMRKLSMLMSQSSFRKVLLLGLVIAVFQQWCGTNVIFNYAQEIFVGAGFDVDGMFINIVITGIANVIFTIVVGCWWLGTHLPDPWHLLFLRGEGLCDGLSRGGRNFNLCDDVGTCHLDAIGRNLPQPYSWHRNGHMYFRPLGGLLHAHFLVPLDECSAWQ